MRRWRWVVSSMRSAGFPGTNMWGDGEGIPELVSAGQGDGHDYVAMWAGIEAHGAGDGAVTDEQFNVTGTGEGWWHSDVAVVEVTT